MQRLITCWIWQMRSLRTKSENNLVYIKKQKAKNNLVYAGGKLKNKKRKQFSVYSNEGVVEAEYHAVTIIFNSKNPTYGSSMALE